MTTNVRTSRPAPHPPSAPSPPRGEGKKIWGFRRFFPRGRKGNQREFKRRAFFAGDVSNQNWLYNQVRIEKVKASRLPGNRNAMKTAPDRFTLTRSGDDTARRSNSTEESA
jgi:hypothetical protein